MTIKPFVAEKPVVLFLCTGNSARSQMAEAFLRKHGEAHFDACSAGLAPKGIHPFTIQVMNEVGISLDNHRSKSLSEYLGKVSASHVIFVCEQAEQSCPRVWPFALNTLCMPFPDPAAVEGTEEEQLNAFREVRDEIEQKILSWLENETGE
ncbi:Arsenate-mycothiol transferase ArsC2 [Thalassoglobus neptunius]|uniref:Arsenate-mycothiol transferase ArsC2 n=1 Tax=Thalassoglobus neptunius TaxID=1938619 RepID=A0A5C5X8W6_9PLAN|nr:arsenate reductase ArsC [Thalassoglobus neptunius]TWT58743.1 Arsenate-mycothiol transferase ArsC2 [Thalassoglobus neptunius]